MQAVILVGGEGTRLRPLTYTTPKAMVPILNRPFLEHLLVYLRGHGVTTVLLALGHQPGPILAYFGDGSRWSIDLQLAVEATPLGSAGAIKQFEARLTQPFFALNGDILTTLNLTEMATLHERTHADVSIALIEVDDPSGFGVVRLGEGDRITEFVEKPPRAEAPSRWANAGVWLFGPETLARVPAGQRSMVETALFPELIADGRRVQGYGERAFWVDIGTPERYLDAQLRLLEQPSLRALPLREWPDTPYLCAEDDPTASPPDVDRVAHVSGPVLLGAGASIGPGARVVGPAALGRGVRLAPGATVERSVLWDGVTVGAGAEVRSSILADSVSVGAGARLSDAVVGRGVAVTAGTVVASARINPASAA